MRSLTRMTVLNAACGMALLAACGGVVQRPETAASPLLSVAPAPGTEAETDGQAMTALEQACLDDPTNAQAWERLGRALAAAGRQARATVALRQAASLREHDARRDYAMLRAAGAAQAAVPAAEAWRQNMPRIEIRQVGAAMVEVRRVEAAQPPQTATGPAPVPTPAPAPMPASPVRLEISNGNGASGMAARLSRQLKDEGWPTVRLSNVPHFAVPRSRIEYRPELAAQAQTLARRLGLSVVASSEQCKFADLRIVLGHDALTLVAVAGTAPPGRYLK